MSFTWKHGIIIASCLTIGVAGAAILASSTPTNGVRVATVASDDPWDMPVPSTNAPVNAAPTVNDAPPPPPERQKGEVIVSGKDDAGDDENDGKSVELPTGWQGPQILDTIPKERDRYK